MMKDEKTTEEPRPYGQNKKPKTLRFTPETFRKLREASRRQGVSETVYVELALRDKFRKDGII
jgi:ribosomal protein L20A (L18A)